MVNFNFGHFRKNNLAGNKYFIIFMYIIFVLFLFADHSRPLSKLTYRV